MSIKKHYVDRVECKLCREDFISVLMRYNKDFYPYSMYASSDKNANIDDEKYYEKYYEKYRDRRGDWEIEDSIGPLYSVGSLMDYVVQEEDRVWKLLMIERACEL